MPTSKRPSRANNAHPTVISLDRVSFHFRNQVALEDISLDVKQGDYLGIIGPNGAGKTTLLRLILGLLQPSSGRISLFGKPVKRLHNRTRIGYVPQKATLLEMRFPVTVREVVSLGRVAKAGLFNRLRPSDQAAVDRALAEMDITHLANSLISELSGGEQQRVFIARALAGDPEVLVLDEPTVSVDIESQDSFYELLFKLNHPRAGRQRPLTLILVSHDIDVVVNEVTRLVCINKRIVYRGKPRAFLKGEYLEKLYGKGRRFILHGHGHGH